MSRILIVYGSTYGHTERTAQRIGSATSDGRVDDGQAANRDRERVRATPDGPVDCAGASLGGRPPNLGRPQADSERRSGAVPY